MTKHPGTGGVSVHTVTGRSFTDRTTGIHHTGCLCASTPCGWSRTAGPGAGGGAWRAGSDKLKVSVSFHGGWRAFGRLIISGPDARSRKPGRPTRSGTVPEAAGVRSLEPSVDWVERMSCSARDPEPGKCCFRWPFAIETSARSIRALRQLVPRVPGTVPGISYIGDLGRPRASEVVAFWPALVS